MTDRLSNPISCLLISLTRCARSLPDCSSVDHDYVFGGAWTYIRPDCRTLGVSDIVTKNKDSVSFTTSIIESVEYAWQHVQSSPRQLSSLAAPGRAWPLWADRFAHDKRIRTLGAQPLP